MSKCPDGRGGHVYQSGPCEHGRAVAEYDTSAVRDSPERIARYEAQRREREQAMAQQRARETVARNQPVWVYGPTASQRQQSRCDAAKAHRKAELDRLGLRRTYDILRNLDAYVQRECSR